MGALRDADSRELDVEAAFPKLVAARTLDDAEDLAAVLHGRGDRWATAAGSRRQAATDLIAGLIPRATGISDPDMARALTERDQAMESGRDTSPRMPSTTATSGSSGSATTPANPAAREVWLRAVSTVAAYRDRWGTGNDHRPLGSENAVNTIEQLGHRNRAQAAVEVAHDSAGSASACPGKGG